MNGVYFMLALAALVVGICYLFRRETEIIVSKVEPSSEPSTPIGTFRLVPYKEKIVVERFQYTSGFHDARGRARWCTQYKYGMRYRQEELVQFDTEREAEEYVKSVLDAEAKVKRDREEKAEREKVFAEAHPVREIPPYKYLSDPYSSSAGTTF